VADHRDCIVQVLESEMLKTLNYNIEVAPREVFDYGMRLLAWKRRSMFRPENL
jgi:hypothetical protein